MPIQTLTNEQIDQLAGTTHPAGIEYPANGLQPYYHWLIRSLHRLADTALFQFKVDLAANDPLSIVIAPGRAIVNETPIAFDGATLDLSDYNNQTVLLFLDDSPSLVNVATSDWPASSHRKIAEITVQAGVITHILDRRIDTLFSL